MQEPEHSWRYDARCQGEDTDLFYPPRDKEHYKEIATKAKSFCLGDNKKNPCPVQKECLWDAVRSEEPHGIWGGLSHRERNALIRKWRKNHKKEMTLKEYIFGKD